MSSTRSSVLHCGAFDVDLTTGELRRNGRTVKLQPQPSKVLALLLERPGELVTREEIRQRLWGDASIDFEHGLNFAVKKIRDALGDDADRPRYIETLPRRGYRFIAPVERVGSISTSRQGSQPATIPESRVTSIAERLRPSQKATRMESTGASGTASLVAVEAASRSLDDEQHGQEPALSPSLRSRVDSAKDAPATTGEAPVPQQTSAQAYTRGLRRWRGPALVVALPLAVAAGSYVYFGSPSTPKLTEKDTIVLADFTNTTGDPLFDGTLRQGLSAQLEQSPFLNLLSDDRIAQTLALMTQKDARLTHNLAREVCLRTVSAATIEGSISSLSTQYVLGLKAANCHNGDLLAEEQETASRKEQVLKALGEAATKLRQRLGESLASIEKYDAPPENVTTPSLEALQAYSLGYRAHIIKGDSTTAVASFQRAISLDPNFAMAYAELGTNYGNWSETARAAENARKAYELRERVSEREKFYIASHYEKSVTGDLEAERKIYELWAQTYPHDAIPRTNLGTICSELGEHNRALAADLEAFKLEPGSALAYESLVDDYVRLNRLDEAKAAVRQARFHNFDAPVFNYFLYLIAFLQNDQAAMDGESAALMAKGYEGLILFNESDTAAYGGQFVKARDLTRRATESTERSDAKELAAGYEVEGAVREALVGNAVLARQQAQMALTLSNGRDVEAISAIVIGLAGDSAQTTRLANDLDKRFPKDTILQSEYLPMIHAASVLGSHSATKNADKAIGALEAAAPYELGLIGHSLNFTLYPVYFRGQAYLAARQGPAAAAEFQKILDHPGVVENGLIGALARLGLGRAYALEAGNPVAAVGAYPGRDGQKQDGAHRAPLQPDALAKARIAYQDFLALWKDADPDIPILKQAKAEYAKLQ